MTDRSELKDNIREKAILVHLEVYGQKEPTEVLLDELAELCDTAGADPILRISQERSDPDPKTYIGKGKAEEIEQKVKELGVDIVIFNNELKPNQLLNLEKLISARIVDRTMLILDIFATRARSREGKIQVEMAQLNYYLPRLLGRGVEMSQIAGGVGTRRGPGETKLEMDRRKIYKRLDVLRSGIEKIKKVRELQRRQRKNNNAFNVAIVGYTNAGKSTLLKALTGQDTFIEDKLFATLDPKSGHALLPNGLNIVFTDTVGFVRNMPKELETAFASTLEETALADLLLFVIDVTNPEKEEQMAAVESVLKDIKASELPRVLVFNKSDSADPSLIAETKRVYSGCVVLSALNSLDIASCIKAVQDELLSSWHEVNLSIPYTDQWAINHVYETCYVENSLKGETGHVMLAYVPDKEMHAFKKYVDEL